MVHFMRFNYLGRKVPKIIEYPKSFNFRVFIAHNIDADLSREEQTPYIYDLYGIIVHAGRGAKSGHYYCFVKTTEDKWFKCNDSRITPISNIKDVLR